MKRYMFLSCLLATLTLSVACSDATAEHPFDRLDVLTVEERLLFYSIAGPGVDNAPNGRERIAKLKATIEQRLAEER